MDSNPRKIMAAGVLNLDDLPDSIIIEKILTLLPIRDAAKTSILSKKWKNHWRNIPALVFDTSFHNSDSVEEQFHYLLDMSQVLLHHRGSIHKFTLSLNLKQTCPQIDDVMLLLRDKDVHEFTFHVIVPDGANHLLKMPSYLFSFQQLSHLDLDSCEFKIPPTFEGFPHLISLAFRNVIFPYPFPEDEDETDFLPDPVDFISKCPLLENLSITYCDASGLPFNIDAPKLKFLHISGNVYSFFFNNTPLLSSVHIYYLDEFGSDVDESVASKLIRFFECLPVVEYLCIGSAFSYMPPENLLTSPRLPITISHLKVLDLAADFSCESGILLVLALVISSPNLQKLKVTPDLFYLRLKGGLIPARKLFKREDLSDVTFQNLHELQMNFHGTSGEVEFIKFMLAKSVVLKTITFYYRRKYERKISIVVAKLASASPKDIEHFKIVSGRRLS